MRAVDLFAGCGGLSLGLMKSGIDVIAAFENWEPAIQIYENNFKHPVFKLDLSNVVEATKLIQELSPDIIAGGPPCQDFSSAGKRNEKGGRGDLTLSFSEIVVNVSPSWFIMENVDRIVKTKIFKTAKKLFEDNGYGLTESILDASLCGVPQRRKRMFLIGKKHESKDFLKDIIDSGLSKESMTVRDYFGSSLGTDFYYRHARSYERRGVFSIDEPSPTIRGVNRPVPPAYKSHPGDATKKRSEFRPLTAKERAQVQTFPKEFIWAGSNKSTLEQIIGNAVPVNLANFVGKAILSHQGRKKKRIISRENIGLELQHRI